MSTDHISALRLVDEMRKRGVSRFTIGDVSAEFHPTEPGARPLPAPRPGDEESDFCRCRHLKTEHTNGLCTAVGGGCEPSVCAGPEKK